VGEDGPVILDLDATLVEAHSEKEGAAATWKRGFGFHPLLAFLDHGPGGTGECVGALLRPGTATANNAGDHIAVLAEALAQLPAQVRDRVLVRADSGGGVHAFLDHLHARGLRYSIGLMGYQPVLDALDALPRQAWKAALDEHGRPREGAQVAELTRYLPPTYKPWPDGMRVIARRERPHPGAQLRITDRDGWRITCFATNVPGGRLAEHERRHRLRARAEDRIRCLKDTGCATCRCTTSPPTRYGSSSSPSPPTCSPGPNCYTYAVLNRIFHWRAGRRVPGCPPPDQTDGAWLAYLCHAPLLLWGPLLVVVTVAYSRRRTATSTASRNGVGVRA